MNKHQNEPLREERDAEKNEQKDIIKGSGQEDQLEKLKQGQKAEKDNTGSKPTGHIKQNKDDTTRLH